MTTAASSHLSVANHNRFPVLPFFSCPRNAYRLSLRRPSRLVCRSSSNSPPADPVKKKKRKKRAKEPEIVKDFVIPEGEYDDSHGESPDPTPLPNPPAGFVLDDQGRVLLASNKRLATIVDPTNNLPLECVIRRVFRSSRGDECLLLCPADMPVQILKSTNIDGWSAVSDEEVESILPSAAYALAKIHMHLVHSGFCFTVRGGFCYSEDDIIDFHTDDGLHVDGLPTEGVEITCFHLDGAHYMIYTPSDPLLFVAVKDNHGQLQIADDLFLNSMLVGFPRHPTSSLMTPALAKGGFLRDLPKLELLEDPSIVSAVDEETEFNALVEEEAALLESVMGER